MSEKQENEIFQSLVIGDVSYKTKLTRKFLMRKAYEPIDPNKIIAHMPGTIIEIKVKVGDIVKKGDLLLIVEAMKMYNNVRAPFNGKIKKIHVEVGQKVPKTDLYLEFE